MLLRDNVEQLLGKLLGIQTQIGGRDWRTLCAISSTAILHRNQMPKKVTDKVVKTEFVAGKVKDLIGSLVGGRLKGKPWFSMQELENIGNFLLEHTAAMQTDPEKVAQAALAEDQIPNLTPVSEPVPLSYAATPEADTFDSAPDKTALSNNTLTCKQCGEAHHLTGMYGQYGYYVKCVSCNANTSMKQPCPACNWRSVSISKDGLNYTATCRKCDHQHLVFQQREERA